MYQMHVFSLFYGGGHDVFPLSLGPHDFASLLTWLWKEKHIDDNHLSNIGFNFIRTKKGF